MSNSIYEKRVVLFIDIVGFKELIESGAEQKIYNVLSTSAAFANSSPSFPELTHATAFSDSVVISHRVEPAGVQNVINTASMLMWSFLHQGILTRGGIACGDMHHTKDRLFGPAMNEAYKLENESAIFPRILVSDDILALVRHEEADGTTTKEGGCDPEVLRQDFDGEWHIHLMTHRILSPFITVTEKEALFNAKVQVIEAALNNPNPPPRKNKRARAKHNWLRNYLQASIKEGPSTNPGEIVR